MRNATAVGELAKIGTINHDPRQGIELVGNTNAILAAQGSRLSHIVPMQASAVGCALTRTDGVRAQVREMLCEAQRWLAVNAQVGTYESPKNVLLGMTVPALARVVNPTPAATDNRLEARAVDTSSFQSVIAASTGRLPNDSFRLLVN